MSSQFDARLSCFNHGLEGTKAIFVLLFDATVDNSVCRHFPKHRCRVSDISILKRILPRPLQLYGCIGFRKFPPSYSQHKQGSKFPLDGKASCLEGKRCLVKREVLSADPWHSLGDTFPWHNGLNQRCRHTSGTDPKPISRLPANITNFY
ncbi:hypothetical protein J437_LFUL016490 [Ladona fulva]|uniref:Uncharacterized protein n=1 Tax=Ladona fulva TaxID=123851 RepID=A0A8K0KJM5_LADFU|nr:hypothetical protein J437_LFUL016490 [Ladona fulva]